MGTTVCIFVLLIVCSAVLINIYTNADCEGAVSHFSLCEHNQSIKWGYFRSKMSRHAKSYNVIVIQNVFTHIDKFKTYQTIKNWLIYLYRKENKIVLKIYMFDMYENWIIHLFPPDNSWKLKEFPIWLNYLCFDLSANSTDGYMYMYYIHRLEQD